MLMKQVRWVEIDERKLNESGMRIKTSKNYRVIECANCGHTWGVNPRNQDSKVLETDLVCSKCGNKVIFD
jgi:DNA-directed RNA polymerase subunit RPC12/RpoP